MKLATVSLITAHHKLKMANSLPAYHPHFPRLPPRSSHRASNWDLQFKGMNLKQKPLANYVAKWILIAKFQVQPLLQWLAPPASWSYGDLIPSSWVSPVDDIRAWCIDQPDPTLTPSVPKQDSPHAHPPPIGTIDWMRAKHQLTLTRFLQRWKHPCLFALVLDNLSVPPTLSKMPLSQSLRPSPAFYELFLHS